MFVLLEPSTQDQPRARSVALREQPTHVADAVSDGIKPSKPVPAVLACVVSKCELVPHEARAAVQVEAPLDDTRTHESRPSTLLESV